MRPSFVALSFAVLATFVSTQTSFAQEKKARGTLSAMAADSITVKVGTTDMKFSVDAKTHVEAPGAGTRSRQATASGAPGPKLSDLLKTGDAVEVTYNDATKLATDIRKVTSPGSGGVPAKNSNGTVTAVSDTSLSISGSSGGGATFTQTFAIDANTKVVGRGLGTQAAQSGGRAAPSSLIGKGDTVAVSFEETGGALRATEIRVTAKASR